MHPNNCFQHPVDVILLNRKIVGTFVVVVVFSAMSWKHF